MQRGCADLGLTEGLCSDRDADIGEKDIALNTLVATSENDTVFGWGNAAASGASWDAVAAEDDFMACR